MIAGSKNVHLVFRTRADIVRYADSRFLVAKAACRAFRTVIVLIISVPEPDPYVFGPPGSGFLNVCTDPDQDPFHQQKI